MNKQDRKLVEEAHRRICCSMAQVCLSSGPAVVLKDGRVYGAGRLLTRLQVKA